MSSAWQAIWSEVTVRLASKELSGKAVGFDNGASSEVGSRPESGLLGLHMRDLVCIVCRAKVRHDELPKGNIDKGRQEEPEVCDDRVHGATMNLPSSADALARRAGMTSDSQSLHRKTSRMAGLGRMVFPVRQPSRDRMIHGQNIRYDSDEH